MASSGRATEICFFRVPPLQSNHVVEYLRGFPGFTTAAAVYSGVDVVALLEGSTVEIEAAVSDSLAAENAPPIEYVERIPTDSVIPGAAFGSSEGFLRSACSAYIRCAIRDSAPVPFAAARLAALPGVIRLFPIASRKEVVVEVVSRDKRSFDDTIMATIQGASSVVQSTRTLLIINHMQWQRDRPAAPSPAFVSVASTDRPFGVELVAAVARDTGLSLWTYSSIPIGSESWSAHVDGVIRAAPFHIFVISRAALHSPECQREFGAASSLTAAERICCLILPDCTIADLAPRYQQRQCLLANDFFAYPRLIAWIQDRLKPTSLALPPKPARPQ